MHADHAPRALCTKIPNAKPKIMGYQRNSRDSPSVVMLKIGLITPHIGTKTLNTSKTDFEHFQSLNQLSGRI